MRMNFTNVGAYMTKGTILAFMNETSAEATKAILKISRSDIQSLLSFTTD
ncbi:MAG: hypothetical protein HBSIN01_03150 [Candidatus Brocadia sinica]|nr:MAG: hypothetical protein BroJett002_33760 [Candidatus Brocadia sinica]GJQ16356.1 MAG: hypothetical protein HBSIN01_03150 [Candidatus Brocadia sinica]